MRPLNRLGATVLAVVLALEPAVAARSSSRTPVKGSAPSPSPVPRVVLPLVPAAPGASYAATPGKIGIPETTALPLAAAQAPAPEAAVAAPQARAVTSKPGTDVTGADTAIDPEVARDPLSRGILRHAEVQGFVLKPQADEILPDASVTKRLADSALAKTTDTPAPAAKPAAYERTSRAFFASLLLGQAGVEIMGLAVPQYAERLANDFQLSSYLYAAGFVALALGGLLAGPAADRFGTRKVYLTTLATRLAAGVALGMLFPQMTLPLLIVLFSLDYLALGASRVAEGKIPNDIHDASQGKVREWGTIQELVTGTMGMIGLFAGERLLALSGYQAAFWSYPVFVGLSGVLLYFFLRLPEPPEAATTAVKSLRRRVTEAWAALKTIPVVRLAALGYAIDAVLTAFVYFVIGPKLGLFAAAALAAETITFGVSLVFAAGAFLGAIVLMIMGRRQEKALYAVSAAERPAVERRLYFRSAARWLLGAAASFLGLWVLPFAQAWGPWYSFAALFPFGFALAGVFVSLEAIMKNETPVAVRGSVFGLVRAIGLIVAAASFLLMGAVFKAFSTSAATGVPVLSYGGFALLAAIFTVAAIAYLTLSRALRRQAPLSAK